MWLMVFYDTRTLDSCVNNQICHQLLHMQNLSVLIYLQYQKRGASAGFPRAFLCSLVGYGGGEIDRLGSRERFGCEETYTCHATD